ncbi:S-adenosyl-L-methionine-dependent methyltransferase [Artemisia annua]|uniref:S-adenosyl-L-methionine-dependent methyltransferase n=1 Tax=Artemisia annua TaxID=35608 RepID=A0A2U1Q0N9_ARTAN|nr:S-adenosyl-L-methionine-dependent methyltransferase [Artemisia annua]
MGKMKLVLSRGILRFVFILGLLSIISVIFLKFYSLKPFLISDTKCIYDIKPQLRINPQIDILETVIKRIEHEIIDIRDSQDNSPYALRYGSFLADILGLIESAKSGDKENEVAKPPESNMSSNVSQFVHISPDFFLTEEIRKYVRIKPNRLGKQNFMGANGTFTSIGHACFSMKEELEEYMNYDVGEICNDDWRLAQRLMVHGCDPLPRRRCISRGPQYYTKPLPIPESIWSLPDDKNVRWSQYRCKNFACLANNKTGKGFFKCADCFNLTVHEMPRWVVPVYPVPSSNSTPDFLITEVLDLKPGEIRIGLDFSVGTATFAARMREHNVTIVSATLNLGAPFSEMIALRGLVPLYMTINQRLPFFDNTLDIIHTTRFLDGWIDFVLLDFILYDWDRVLRPGGLLWIDSFFCLKEDLDDYLDGFRMLRYKKHKWVVVPKVDKDDDREVFFSAVLEKPPRPF